MRIIITLMVCLNLSSCIFSDKENVKPSIKGSTLRNLYIENSPEINDLFGEWTITDYSKKLILDHANSFPTWDSWSFPFQHIQFLEGGLVKAWVNTAPLPKTEEMFSEDVKNGIIIGNWKITKTEIRKYYYSDSLNSYLIDFNFGQSKYSYNCFLYLRRQNKELILWTHLQDPDNSEYQEFKKNKK